jgi:hypothetical protein
MSQTSHKVITALDPWSRIWDRGRDVTEDVLNVSVDGDQVLLQQIELCRVVSALSSARGPQIGLNSSQPDINDGRVSTRKQSSDPEFFV